jgi:transcriptional regulator with XRE-family HTH domain
LTDRELMGSRLKSAREKLRFSQKEAAARLGIHNSTLGKYELGEREPDLETIRKIANLYGVSPDWIIFGKDGGKKEVAQKFLEYLELDLTNEEIKERLKFKVDNLTLTDEEVDDFISYVRWQRAKKKQQASPLEP